MYTRLFHAIVIVGGALGGVAVLGCGPGEPLTCDPVVASEANGDQTQGIAGSTSRAVAAHNAGADCTAKNVAPWPPTKC